MDRTEFETVARRDGYSLAERAMKPDTFNPDHTHDFDARVMILDGEFSLTMNGVQKLYQPGDWCAVPAGTIHAERCGAGGVSFLVARRQPA